MKYVALLRGIAPTNPNMRNDKLRGVFESLGFTNVKTVISSGNVLFESPSQDAPALEAKIEKAIPIQLGFTSTTIIRTQAQLQALVTHNPFGKLTHSAQTYLTVTFLKNKPNVKLKFPHKVKDRDYTLLGMYDNAVCAVLNQTSTKTPDLMVWLEKQFGKDITTRTYKTVERILKAF